MKKIIAYILIGSLLFANTACQKDIKTNIDQKGAVNIHLQPVVDATALDFTSNYQNAFGEQYTVKSFKYYIHKLELISNNGTSSVIGDDYFLIDAANPGSMHLSFKATEGSYKAIAFTIGVDSTSNVSGAQTNALDPANGMFWTWNSGYIMAKFEGVSPVSNQPGNRFEFHIGGFRGNENVVKRIELPFPSGGVQVLKDKTSSIDISANANAWFNGIHPLDISSTPVCMTPGVLAKSFADNYYHMFSVTRVENNE